MSVGHLADVAVEGVERPLEPVGEAPADPPARVSEVNRTTRRTASAVSCRDGGVVAGVQVVEVGARAQDVVGPGVERDDVRAQGQGRAELLGDDLVEQLAADGEVGVRDGVVGDAGAVGGEPGGDPVGPAR